MKIAITGICGFVGSELALQLARRFSGAQIAGIDNFSRPGSETTRPRLKAAGVVVKHGDVRCPSDLDALGAADWVIDAAANPSVLVGVDGRTSSRQAVEHNLVGTLNVLEFCKAQGAGLVLLSTSRVYSVKALNALPLVVRDGAFTPDTSANWPHGAAPSRLDRGVLNRRPGLAVWRHEGRVRSDGHRIRGRVRLPGRGRPVWRHGRTRTVRDRGTGHLLVLGPCVGVGSTL